MNTRRPLPFHPVSIELSEGPKCQAYNLLPTSLSLVLLVSWPPTLSTSSWKMDTLSSEQVCSFIWIYLISNLPLTSPRSSAVRSTTKGDYLKNLYKTEKFSYVIVPDVEKHNAFDEVVAQGKFDGIMHTASPFHVSILGDRWIGIANTISPSGISQLIAKCIFGTLVWCKGPSRIDWTRGCWYSWNSTIGEAIWVSTSKYRGWNGTFCRTDSHNFSIHPL